MLMHPPHISWLSASFYNCEAPTECLRLYRAVLALDTGAVEAQSSDTMAGTLYVNHALVAPLAWLRLWEVSGPQGDGSDLAGGNEYFSRVKQLRAILKKKCL